MTQLGDSLLTIRILFFGINPFCSHWWPSRLCCVWEAHSISLVSYWLHFSCNKLCLTWLSLCLVNCLYLYLRVVAGRILMLCICSGGKNLLKLLFPLLFELLQETELLNTHMSRSTHGQAAFFAALGGRRWWVYAFPGPRNVSWICAIIQ